MNFARAQTNSLERLRVCTDLSYLKNELALTKKSMPDCVENRKISILETRIKELEDEIAPYITTD